jgi:hypothetical protein
MSLLVGIGICILGVFWRFTRRRLPLPPGPKGRFPFMGMTFDMPKTSPWVTITEWAKLVLNLNPLSSNPGSLTF